MKVLKDNGLTIVLMVATMATLAGMLMTGISVYNDDLAQHHQPGEPVQLPLLRRHEVDVRQVQHAERVGTGREHGHGDLAQRVLTRLPQAVRGQAGAGGDPRRRQTAEKSCQTHAVSLPQ